jgi:hypothetical protein
VRSLDIPQGPRSRIPGVSEGRRRRRGRGAQPDQIRQSSSKPPPGQLRRRLQKRRKRRPSRTPRPPFRDLTRSVDARSSRDALPKNLTRRANHRHKSTIARILQPAPGNRPRAFSIGRQPHSQSHILPMAAIVARRVCKRAAVRTILADMIRADALACSGKNRIRLAGARERVGARRGQSPRPHAASLGR